MRENLQCNCHICKIEKHLVIALSEPHYSDQFLRLAQAAAPWRRFRPLAPLSNTCTLTEMEKRSVQRKPVKLLEILNATDPVLSSPKLNSGIPVGPGTSSDDFTEPIARFMRCRGSVEDRRRRTSLVSFSLYS